MNICNLPDASLIITTMKVHFVVIGSMQFCISVNEKWSFFHWGEHQFERRNVGQKRWSECLIYWWIRQMTRWCVIWLWLSFHSCTHLWMDYILYEWTLVLYEWSLIFYECFQCPAQIFSAGCCTDPHHICHEYWLTASQPFPSLENSHQLNGATLPKVPNVVGAACSQWQTGEIYKRLPFCQGGTKSDTMHAPQLVILYSSN